MGLLDGVLNNLNLKDTVNSLKDNKELMAKLSSAKDDKEIQKLVSTATDALKDSKISDDEKQELAKQLKGIAAGLFGKK